MSIGDDALDFFKGLLPAPLRELIDGPPPPRKPPPPERPPATTPARSASPKPVPLATPASKGLAPLRSWAHPVSDKADPLKQLTHLSKAAGGYYPVGRNGLWHGGVHFDAATAGIERIDQRRVLCLADGEVVAYRIASETPSTAYYPSLGSTALEAKFANGFVLVRHHLQAPLLKSRPGESPPNLIFYSLYMHLQDWDSYEKAPQLPRPAVWEARMYRVKADVADSPLGASVYASNGPNPKVIATLPRGAEIGISAEDGHPAYFRLTYVPNPNSPALAQAISSKKAFVRTNTVNYANGKTLVNNDAVGAEKGDRLHVHAQASSKSTVIAALARGTEVIVSGQGEYRKLEHVLSPEYAGPGESDFTNAQGYLRFSALEPLPRPQHLDKVAILHPPIPIKAGDLIGHIGQYQSAKTSLPVQKLHLEVFTKQDMKAFLHDSRTWAAGLPAEEKTWLKLVKGTAVLPHQEYYSDKLQPVPAKDDPVSGTDLLIPRSLLDDLKPTHKIQVKARENTNARNWYRLDDLLNDKAGKLLKGWVCEEIGVTPWVSPWEWEGYDVIDDHHLYDDALSRMRITSGTLSKEEEEKLLPRAEKWDTSPLPNRLYEIIDKDHNDVLSPDEIQAALGIPAYAQAISQLVIRYESEWHYVQSKWDGLDDVIGHTTSTPALNSEKEKERVKALKWWDDVAVSLGLPADGRVYHLHPVGLMVAFAKKKHPNIIINGATIELEFLFINEEKIIENEDFVEAAERIGCEIAAIKAVAATETGSTGSFYLTKGWDSVPAILYERHYFHNLTAGQYDQEDQSISNSTPGGYGKDSEQYPKLLRAYKLAPAAALQSASWGKFQIMGKNFKSCGFNSVEDFVFSISQSEKNHLKAFVNFILNDKNLTKAIIKKDWLSFAQIYNGPRQEGYDSRMEKNYELFNK